MFKNLIFTFDKVLLLFYLQNLHKKFTHNIKFINKYDYTNKQHITLPKININNISNKYINK